jgi:integral membrane sensor domain MASE1
MSVCRGSCVTAAFGLSDLQAGVSARAIAWFVLGNTLEVLTAALGLRYCFHGVPRLSGVRALAEYSLFAVILAPLAGSFLSAHGIGPDYWVGWRTAFLSEVLAFATVTPVLLSWINGGRALMRMSGAFYLEGLILISGLILLSYVTFTHPQNLSSPALLFSLVPFLLFCVALRMVGHQHFADRSVLYIKLGGSPRHRVHFSSGAVHQPLSAATVLGFRCCTLHGSGHPRRRA